MRVLTRVVGLGLGAVGGFVLGVATTPEGSVGANIGAGLLGFAGVAVVALGWALVDAVRQREAWPVVGTWGVASAGFAVLAMTYVVIRDGDFGRDAIQSGLTLVPTLFVLALTPATLGVLLGTLVSRRR